MSSDWTSKWFDVYEEIGEFEQIAFARKLDGHEPEYFFLPHQRYDGLGGLRHLINERSNVEITLPQLKNHSSPFFPRGLWGLFVNLILHRIILPKWKIERSDLLGEKRNPTLLSFSKDETKKIIEASKKSNISVNSFLFHFVDQAVSELLWDQKKSRWWMLPVNLRGYINKERMNDNHTSYIVSVLKNQTPKKLDEKIKKSLLWQWHKATHFLVNIGKIIGYNGILLMVKHQFKMKYGWTGSFSNLGSINASRLENETWFFCPPNNRAVPLGVGILTLNGKLTLSFLLHPSLDPRSTYVTSLRDQVKKSILEEVGQ